MRSGARDPRGQVQYVRRPKTRTHRLPSTNAPTRRPGPLGALRHSASSGLTQASPSLYCKHGLGSIGESTSFAVMRNGMGCDDSVVDIWNQRRLLQNPLLPWGMNTQYSPTNVQLPKKDAAVIDGEECSVSARCLPVVLGRQMTTGWSVAGKTDNPKRSDAGRML